MSYLDEAPPPPGSGGPEGFDHAGMAATLRHWQNRWFRVKEEQARMLLPPSEMQWSEFDQDRDEIIKTMAMWTHPELVDRVIDLLAEDIDHHAAMARDPGLSATEEMLRAELEWLRSIEEDAQRDAEARPGKHAGLLAELEGLATEVRHHLNGD